MLNYYEILGLNSTATAEEIKTAYRKLAMKYHPDRVSDINKNQVEKKFKEINLAYSVLSDPSQKKEYDNSFNNGNIKFYNTGDFENIFNSFFYSQKSNNIVEKKNKFKNIFNRIFLR